MMPHTPPLLQEKTVRPRTLFPPGGRVNAARANVKLGIPARP